MPPNCSCAMCANPAHLLAQLERLENIFRQRLRDSELQQAYMVLLKMYELVGYENEVPDTLSEVIERSEAAFWKAEAAHWNAPQRRATA